MNGQVGDPGRNVALHALERLKVYHQTLELGNAYQKADYLGMWVRSKGCEQLAKRPSMMERHVMSSGMEFN